MMPIENDSDIRHIIDRFLKACPGMPDFPLGKPLPIPTGSELLFLEEIQVASAISTIQLDSIRKDLSIAQGYQLVIFAIRMAILAVRISRPDFLVSSLIGIVADDDAVDYRDVLRAIAIIEDCASRLRIDFDSEIKNACRFASARRRSLILQGYLSRPVDMKGIAVMGFTAVGESESLEYDKSF